MKLLQAILLASAPGLLALGVAAQAPTVPPGFEVREVVSESAQAPLVRGVAFTGDACLLAIGRDLELRRAGSAPRLLLRLHPGQEFAFVAVAPGNRALIGELHGGRIHELDLVTGQVLGSFAGPRNAFDAVPLGSGDVLLNANPLWPAGNANAGIWLAGPSQPPRELLALSGPSGPLALDPNGDLVVAELGPIVPPPPGSARLLRFAGAMVQQAILTGGSLSVAQATATANGYSGIYDLAFDDLGRVHVSDPGSSIVMHSAPGGLAPAAVTLDLGSGRYGLWLGFDAHPGAPFLGFQPGDRAPALLVSSSDFAQRFATCRLMPMRPALSCTAATALPALGTASLTIAGGPPHGVGVLLATASPPVPEYVTAVVAGVPLWLGLPSATAVTLSVANLDLLGSATRSITNPGGYALTLTIQAAVLGATGAGPAVGSSTAIALQLRP